MEGQTKELYIKILIPLLVIIISTIFVLLNKLTGSEWAMLAAALSAASMGIDSLSNFYTNWVRRAEIKMYTAHPQLASYDPEIKKNTSEI